MKRDKGTGLVALVVTLLLAVTMIPAAGIQPAFADEQFAADGLIYKTVDGGAVLVGFEDGGALGDNVAVPEKVSGEAGELTVTGVDVAEGQAAPGVKALTLPQTVESINTKSLAAALPGLVAVNVDGTAGAYSSANGLLFRQADEAASSDGSTVKVANRELLWTPPATVIARIPGTCKRVAAGAFTDAAALETIMAFSTVESIARPEKDAEGNTVKEGAFTDEQVSRVNIVIPISATVQPEGIDRISTDVFLSEQVGLDVKQTPWCDYGFDIKRFTVGIPCGSTSVTVAVPEDGVVETPVITVGDYVGYPQWNPKPGEVDWPKDGLVFEYKADMTVSIGWDGDKNAVPAHLELPAYVIENGVKTAVTEIAPNAFENAAQLESVVIPEGVTTIGESSFAGCSGLKSVSLPSTLKTIDYAAFKGAGLESVDIPSGVRWVGGEAFDERLNSTALKGSSVENSKTIVDDMSAYSSVAGQVGGVDFHADNTRPAINYPGYTFVPTDTEYDDTVTYVPTNEALARWENTTTDYKDHYGIWWAGLTQFANTAKLFFEEGVSPHFSIYSPADNKVYPHTLGVPYSPDLRVFYGYGTISIVQRNNAYATSTAVPPAIEDYMMLTPGEGHIAYVQPPEVTDADRASYVDLFTATLNHYTISYDSATSSVGGDLRTSCTVEDRFLSEPNARPGYRFVGWTAAGLDGITPTEDVDLKKVVAAADAAGTTTLSFEGHWQADVAATVAGGANGGISGLAVSESGPYAAADGNPALATFEGGKLVVRGSGLTDAAHAAWVKVDSSGNLLLYASSDDVANNRLGATLEAKPDSGYHVSAWTLDGSQMLVPGGNAVSMGNDPAGHALSCAFVGNEYKIEYDAGGGAWDTTTKKEGSYTTGTGRPGDLDTMVEKDGFWLKGWVWTTAEVDGVSHSGMADPGEPTFTIPSDAYGNVKLKAVWEPRVYRAVYKTPPTAGKTGLGSTDFVHEAAVAYIDGTKKDGSAAGESDPDDSMMAQWGTAYREQPGYSDTDSGSVWIDTSGVSDKLAAWSLLAGSGEVGGDPGHSDEADNRLDLPGYDFKGWCADAVYGADTGFDTGEPAGTAKSVTADNMEAFFASVWDGTTTKPADKGAHEMNVYGVWKRLPGNAVALGQEQPADTNNEVREVKADGEAEAEKVPVVIAAPKSEGGDGKEVAPGTTGIYYWQGRGLVSEAEKGKVDKTPSVGTSVKSRKGDPAKDVAIDADMGLAAPQRYGFKFLGWGKRGAAGGGGDVLYVSYNEDVARAGEATGFYLTSAGAKLMEGDPEEVSPEAWEAVWERRTVEVALRIPAHAVSDVDRDGASTGADRGGVEGSTTYQYTFAADEGEAAAAAGSEAGATYAWREGTAAETGNGATSGWLIAKRTWGYYDLLEYPAFSPQKDRYTYDGWYDAAKPSTTDSTDKALADNPGVRKVATYDALSVPSGMHVSGEWAANKDSGLDIDDKFFLTGDASDLNGVRGMTVKDGGLSKELWLWTSPIRINVASPMGVYLCTTNSYGQAVEPYVVGNDRRTQLEAQAEFSVSTSSHDLQLVDVTAEDVIEYSYDETGAVNSASVVSQAVPTAPDEGVCDKILNPRNTGGVDNLEYDEDGSRMFWVSPVPTATADQTGFIFKGGAASAEAAAEEIPDGAESARMTDAEKLLVPDVSKRRYFGFGTKGADGKADNRISDKLASEYDEKEGYGSYELGDFILRKNYVNGVTDGLAQTGVDEASGAVSYRFYYGLDMRRAEFDLKGLQDLIDNGGLGLSYDSAFDQPLLRVKFTFAAARNPGISYYSMALSEDGAAAAANAYDAAAEAADDRVDEATEITAGAPAVLR